MLFWRLRALTACMWYTDKHTEKTPIHIIFFFKIGEGSAGASTFLSTPATRAVSVTWAALWEKGHMEGKPSFIDSTEP